MNSMKYLSTSAEHEMAWGIDTQIHRLQATLANCSVNSRVLDVGTGRGAYVRTLMKRGIDAIGVDQSSYEEWGELRGQRFFVAEAHHLPFNDKEFDCTICFEVLEHCKDPKAVLYEIARCTKHRVILSVPDCSLDNTLRKHDLAMAHWTDPTHCNYFTKETLEELLTDSSYKIISKEGCYRINTGNYFWDSIRIPLPRSIRQKAKKITNRLRIFEAYWSSILVVAEIGQKA